MTCSLAASQDWSAHVRLFHDEGYCIVRQLISPKQLAELTERLVMAARGQLDSSISIQVEPTQLGKEPDPHQPLQHIRKVAYLIKHDVFFRAFVIQDRLVRLAQALMGDDLVCMGDEAQLKPPRVGSAHPWHQDQLYYSGLVNPFVTLWLAVDPATQANGCIQVIPGSHQAGMLPRQDSSKAWFEEGEVDTRGAIHAELEPGDVLAFHSLVLHGSDANHTSQARKSFIWRYMDLTALPEEHWSLVEKHGVVLDGPDVHPIFQKKEYR